jgi:hypothetical protein
LSYTTLLSDLKNSPSECPPLQVGFGANEKDEISLQGGVCLVEESGTGPLQLSLQVLSKADRGARAGEVEELLRIDAGESLRRPLLGQKAHRRSRRLTGIIPASEGHHQNWTSQGRHFCHFNIAHLRHALAFMLASSQMGSPSRIE